VTPQLRRIGGLLVAPALWAAGLGLIVLGNVIGGFALLIAGSFARFAVRANRRRAELEHAIDGITVGAVMEIEPLVVAPDETLGTFGDALDGEGPTTVARVILEDRLVGLVGVRELRRVPRERWATTHASEVMAGTDALPVLAPGDALRPVADRLGASAAPGFPVLDEGRVAGILTRLAVGRVLDQRATRSGAASKAGASDGAAPPAGERR
jgi:CBS domain-containing protein